MDIGCEPGPGTGVSRAPEASEAETLQAEAFRWAARLHAGQVRKGSGAPYLSHLLEVASTVVAHGGGPSVVAAALLHDVLEDTEADERWLEDRFGSRVREIVAKCSDSTTLPKPPWEERKRAFCEQLENEHPDPDVALVLAADKLSNVRALRRELRTGGAELLGVFNAPPERQLKYLWRVTKAVIPHVPAALADELVDELRGLEEDLTRLGVLRPESGVRQPRA